MNNTEMGFLLVTNNVDAFHEDEFNEWYQHEHLSERLGAAGFLTARRYISVDSPQKYAALYETHSPQALVSPSYAEMLRAPTDKTRAIMPYFQDMTRAIGRVAFRMDHGAGAMLAIIFIAAPQITDADAARLGEVATRVTAMGMAPEAVRVIIGEPDSIGVDTPESKLRRAADRRADAMLVVEWMQANSNDLYALGAAVMQAGWEVETDRGGLYRMLCARYKGGEA